MTDRSHLPDPGWGMIGALIAIGLAGPAIVLSGHAVDLATSASAPPPATAPDVEPLS
ncbi:hypothetical protein [Streptomyces sp. ISL-94]|uniref:hypothetical protein n=1 Tax=Streptomyces sp. ISL-94 TaxID=2819190 RepID=UPI001BE63AF3|nr:hypothetical protein [Streptomyces sp. ISL-94]MBT2480794.1 hypothetical protein [Streptomyces sp. ISL-94]